MTHTKRQSFPYFAFLPAALLFGIFSVLHPSSATADVDWGSLCVTPIKEIQAVNADGSSAWSIGSAGGYIFRGVVLNDPALMLDVTPAEGYDPGGSIGGQWQVYVQAVLDGDVGGMALWMGQNYGNLSWISDPGRSYSNGAWTAELQRLNFPTYLSTGQPVNSPLRPGDLVEVHARTGKAYKGKYNCNENHQNDAAFDFDIYVIVRDQPLQMTDVLLENIKNGDDFFFDPTRQSGGEFYQGQRVRLRNVTITNPEQWGLIDPETGEYYMINVSDGTRTFDVVLGQNDSFAGTSAPAGQLDVIGIFDQESSDSVYSTDGYRMWALTPDDFAMVPEPGMLSLLAGCGLTYWLSRKQNVKQ